MFVFLCPDTYLMAQASASELRLGGTPGQCHPPYTLGMPAEPHSHGAGGFCQEAPSTLSHQAEVVLWQPGLLLSISRAPRICPAAQPCPVRSYPRHAKSHLGRGPALPPGRGVGLLPATLAGLPGLSSKRKGRALLTALLNPDHTLWL